MDGNVHLGRPTRIRAAAQPVTDHLFEPAHGGFDAGADGRGSNQGNTRNEESLYYLSSIDFRYYLELARFEPRPEGEARDLLRRWPGGDGLRSRMDQRRATEVDVAVHVLNRMLELGRPESVRIA